MASSSSNGSSSNTSSSSGNAVQRASVSRERVLKPTKGKYSEKIHQIQKTFVDRIKQFPGESLCLRNSKLFCDACKELLSSKKSILQNHVASKKHDSGKAKIKKKKKKPRRGTKQSRRRLDQTIHRARTTRCRFRREHTVYRWQRSSSKLESLYERQINSDCSLKSKAIVLVIILT